MAERECYVCEKSLDSEESFEIRIGNESYDLCEKCFNASNAMFAHIEKRRKQLEGEICCKNYDKNCEYDGTWLCKNPDCKTPIITSTLPGAHPSGCPKIDKWNSKKESEGNRNGT